MYHFMYATKKELAPVRNQLMSIITEMQDVLQEDFTFQFYFVGSSKRHMVTYDPTSNIGFDFDVNLEINDDFEEYSADELRHKIMRVLDKVARKYGYRYAEDSTRVITIKVKHQKNSRILHSCDFAIVNNYENEDDYECQEYIRFNKKQKSYTWEDQSDGYYMLHEKEEWIKVNGHHEELRDLYLHKKNRPYDPHKHSRSLYAEAVHEICQRYGFYN